MGVTSILVKYIHVHPLTKNQVHGAVGLHYAGLVLFLARAKKENK